MRAPKTYKITTYVPADPDTVPVPVYPTDLYLMPANMIKEDDLICMFPEYARVSIPPRVNDNDTVSVWTRDYFSGAETFHNFPAGLMLAVSREDWDTAR